eukprot:726639_1
MGSESRSSATSKKSKKKLNQTKSTEKTKRSLNKWLLFRSGDLATREFWTEEMKQKFDESLQKDGKLEKGNTFFQEFYSSGKSDFDKEIMSENATMYKKFVDEA